ncbi:MAG: adenosylcobalamin-dependent ribonucleoside-diphosphate reductase [Nanoarchaeota archaeon]
MSIKTITKQGLKIERKFTRQGINPLEEVEYETKSSKITEPDGTIIFQMDNIEAPKSWSQLAIDIAASKYFKRAQVPTPEGRETSVKQMVSRVSSTIRQFGEENNYFETKEDAQAFEDELNYMLINQMGAFNSPVWFNVGLFHKYGIIGNKPGTYFYNLKTDQVEECEDSYSHPQASACFIQKIEDSLDSIYELITNESKIFKFGSGTGTNFSSLRGVEEPLSGGGKSSGLMSYLRILDRSAAAVKSGGITRRAAKMCVLDMDHPEIEDYIMWKVKEEDKVQALIAAGYTSDFNGEAYQTVSGQNSNNSVMIPDKFMKTVIEDKDWPTIERTTKKIRKTYKARDLMKMISEAAWRCADPGVMFYDTMNKWNVCADTEHIHSTNPCAEFVFLDGTACNLASINLMKLMNEDVFDIESFRHACKIFIIAQEIIVDLASYPIQIIAKRSHDLRPLGLGHANLGTLLMTQSIPYDSEKGRAIATAITAILTGHAYKISAEIAAIRGSFPDYEKNKGSMMRVMSMHREAAYKIDVRHCPSYLLDAAREDWDQVVELGEKYGFRNAQATVLAPTGCLVGNSLVPTENGLVRLKNLGNPRGDQWQDTSFEVMTDEGPRKATKFYINGMAKTRTIKTSSGYEIQGTEQHKIKVLNPENKEFVWKKVSDVKEGDIVPLAMNTLFGKTQEVLLPPIPELHWNCDFELKTPKNMSESLAEIIGYFMGDGSLHSKGLRFCVSNEDIDVVEHLGKIIKNLFNKDIKVSQCKGYKEVAINSVPLTMWWDACGFSKIKPSEEHYGKGYKPYIPEAILHTNSKDIYSAFLRGLFEADGTITVGNPSFSTVNKEFSEEIKTLLLCLGYPTTTKIDVSGWGKSALYVLRLKNISYNEYFMKNISFIGKRKINKVNLNRSLQTGNRDYVYLSEETVDEVAPVGNSHRDVVLVSLKRPGAIPRERIISIYQDTQNPKLLRALQFFYDTIESNDDGGIQPTYDLSVPENVTYVANGFVSHNTIALLMGCDTTGIEPEFSLIKWKKLAGGGHFKIINASIEKALQKLNYDEIEIKEIIDYISENGNIEHAPYIKKEHIPIFDCANKNPGGSRFIEPMGHVKMMATVQPFVSGAISKTVNLPNEATVKDIQDIYFQAWRLGLKDIALYRDGCKLSQPLNTKLEQEKSSSVMERGTQKKLPYKRKGITIATKISGNKIFLRTGEYIDGKIGEIFIDMHKAGSSYKSLLNCFAIAVSTGLQYGVPLEKYVEMFTFTRFEPSGLTDHPNIKSATSVIDFIFRVLGMEYLDRTDFVHVPPKLHPEIQDLPKKSKEESKKSETQAKLLNDTLASKEKHLSNMLGDAPLCDQCGHTTIRNGSCYKCLNCGNSMGCS